MITRSSTAANTTASLRFTFRYTPGKYFTVNTKTYPTGAMKTPKGIFVPNFNLSLKNIISIKSAKIDDPAIVYREPKIPRLGAKEVNKMMSPLPIPPLNRKEIKLKSEDTIVAAISPCTAIPRIIHKVTLAMAVSIKVISGINMYLASMKAMIRLHERITESAVNSRRSSLRTALMKNPAAQHASTKGYLGEIFVLQFLHLPVRSM